MAAGGGKVGRPRVHESAAARVRACRDRRKVRAFTVTLTEDTYLGLEAYIRFKDLTKSGVIERLICTQLLRKR